MGQYYVVVNLDKKEYLNPCDFDEGAKLREFGSDSKGLLTALAILLANSNGRGGGDAQTVLCDGVEYAGRWAADRIVIAGDYADLGDPGEDAIENLYDRCKDVDRAEFKSISFKVQHAFRNNLRGGE